MDSSWIVSVFTGYAEQLPILVVLLVGAIFALVRWSEHPRVSGLALLGILLLLLGVLVFTPLGIFLPRFLFREMHVNIADLGNLLTAMRIVHHLVNAAGLGLLLVAVFGWRRFRPAIPRDETEVLRAEPGARTDVQRRRYD